MHISSPLSLSALKRKALSIHDGVHAIMTGLCYYFWRCLPSDNVQLGLQRWSLISTPRKTRKTEGNQNKKETYMHKEVSLPSIPSHGLTSMHLFACCPRSFLPTMLLYLLRLNPNPRQGSISTPSEWVYHLFPPRFLLASWLILSWSLKRDALREIATYVVAETICHPLPRHRPSIPTPSHDAWLPAGRYECYTVYPAAPKAFHRWWKAGDYSTMIYTIIVLPIRLCVECRTIFNSEIPLNHSKE